jgi:hypothetical protein
MTAETPVLDTLADITAVSLERCSLAPRELMLARIAALMRTQPKINYQSGRLAAGRVKEDRLAPPRSQPQDTVLAA